MPAGELLRQLHGRHGRNTRPLTRKRRLGICMAIGYRRRRMATLVKEHGAGVAGALLCSYLDDTTEALLCDATVGGPGPQSTLPAHSQLLEHQHSVLYRPHAGSILTGSAADCQPR
jgi:hypothetical protein